MTEDNEIKKGNIYYAKLDPIVGSEQNGTRPVVVVQNDIGNKYSPTILIAPITSKVYSKPNLPTHVILKANGKITHDSIILLEQIRVIDKSRLSSYLCDLKPYQIEQIDRALINAFDLKIQLEVKNVSQKKK